MLSHERFLNVDRLWITFHIHHLSLNHILSAKRSVEGLSLRVGSVFITFPARCNFDSIGLFLFIMAKDLPYLKWEPNAWDTGNIQMCSHASKGLFADLISLYWSRLGEVPYALALQKLCNGNADLFSELLKHEIFIISKEQIVIKFLDEQLEERGIISEKRREAAEKRWSDANALQVESKSNAKRREEKRREDIYGEGSISIAIRAKYANQKPKRIYSLKEFFDAEKQSADLETKGWVHYDAFIAANPGRVFNDTDHVYNAFRDFCIKYKPPEASKKFDEAEYNKTLWSLEGWEKHYHWRLNNEPDFRKHFGYGELQKGTSVGGRNNGTGGLKGTSGP